MGKEFWRHQRSELMTEVYVLPFLYNEILYKAYGYVHSGNAEDLLEIKQGEDGDDWVCWPIKVNSEITDQIDAYRYIIQNRISNDNTESSASSRQEYYEQLGNEYEMEYYDERSLINIGTDIELEMFYILSVAALILLISSICFGIGCIIGFVTASERNRKNQRM